MSLYVRKLDARQSDNLRSAAYVPPVVILHGLFGSGDNWASMARRLAQGRAVASVDITNHGRSPHSAHFSYPSMAADLWETLDAADIGRCILLGHSVGGKLAMVAALGRPQQVAALIVVDIAPKHYPPIHTVLIEAMQEVEAAAVGSRQAAESILRQRIANSDTRAFLLKSFVPSDDGENRHSIRRSVWRFHLAAIQADYNRVCDWPQVAGRYDGAVLCVVGEHSEYRDPRDAQLFRHQFPQAQEYVLKGAGHWAHVDAPDEFLQEMQRFLATVS